MPYLLNIGYVLLLVLIAPWIVCAALTKGKYREGFGEKLLGLVPERPGNGPCVWLHGVSVGEISLLTHLARQLQRCRPECELVVSTTTRTGYALAKSRFPNSAVFYCPLDFSWAVHRAVRRVRPDLLVLAELELWPNLVAASKHHGCRVAVVNGRMSQSSWRGYRLVSPVARRILNSLDLLAVQTKEYADRFVQLGAAKERVIVTGSIKFDGAETRRHNSRTSELRHLAGIDRQDVVFLAGSTQAPEEMLAVDTFRQLSRAHPHLRLLLVPRHPERFREVAALLEKSGLDWQRRSRLEIDGAHPVARVLLVDTVGELGAWWGVADVAFVGGSLGRRGGQNMIEPAGYGAAVCFGPNTRNFRDVVASMIRSEAAVVVRDGAELTQFVARCLRDEEYCISLGQRARELVVQNRGATEKTCQLLYQLLDNADPHRSIVAAKRHAKVMRKAS